MSEINKPVNETKPPVVKPESPEDAAMKAVEAELAKLPSLEEMQKQIETMNAKKLELEKLQDLKQNFGPGKPGKKAFDLPKLPRGLGQITINGEAFVGKKKLTHQQHQEWIASFTQRIELENKMRYGEGVADQELRAMAGNGVQVARTGETAKF